MKPKFKRTYESKTPKFNPNRQDINQAVNEYLKSGGKITRLKFDDKSYGKAMNGPGDPVAVDEFLAA